MTNDSEIAASAETAAVLDRYERELYNARNLDMVAELIADPMFRHDAGGKVSTLSNTACRNRIGGFFKDYQRLSFRTVHRVIQGTIASWTYDLTLTNHDGTEATISSIETFEITDGKIRRVWNAEYTDGPWA